MKSLASNRLRLVVVLAGVNLVLAAGGWLLLVAPQRHHAQAAAQQTQQAQAQLAQLAASMATKSKRPVIATADLYRLAQAMPATADEPDLLLALDQLAKSSGVRVLGIAPQAPSAAVGYTVLPVALSLSGDYASLTRFLHRLRDLVSVRHGKLVASGRLLSVTSISLTPGTRGQETAAVSVDAFVYGTLPGTTPSTSTSTTGTTTTAGH